MSSAKIIRSVKLLEQFGRKLGMPDAKHLGNDIFELRTIQGNNIARCLYFFTVGDKAIVTNGITKKTQKTPSEVIDLKKGEAERKALAEENHTLMQENHSLAQENARLREEIEKLRASS